MTYIVVRRDLETEEVFHSERKYTLDDAEVICDEMNRIDKGVFEYTVKPVAEEK